MSTEKQPYKTIIAWQKAFELVKEIYRLTAVFPKHELYGLVSQVRRASVSVTANIVEGSAKNSRKDFIRFLNIAEGSLTECSFLLELSQDLGYLNLIDYQHVEEIRAKTAFLLYRFKQHLIHRED